MVASLRLPAAGYIDLGTEPPLTIGRAAGAPIRRAVSVRWFSGTVLTGLTSIFLMGGALLTAIDVNQIFVSAPQATGATASAAAAVGERGDRFMPGPPAESAQQIIPVSMVSDQGDRRVMRERPFVLVTTGLAAARSVDIEVPPYDALAIISDGAEVAVDAAEGAGAEQIYTADVDGEISVRTTPFPLDVPPGEETALASAAIAEIVREAAPSLRSDGVQVSALAFAGSPDLAIDDVALDAVPVQGMQIIPENISFISRSDPAASIYQRESLLSVGDGETLAEVLARGGVAAGEAEDALAVMAGLIELSAIAPGDGVRIAFAADDDSGSDPAMLRVSIFDDGIHQATVARSDRGSFVRGSEPSPLPEGYTGTAPVAAAGQMPRLYDALYLAAAEQGVPEATISELIHIFAFDLDLQSPVLQGDSLRIFYPLPDSEGGSEQEILYAAVVHAGVATGYYRYQTGDDGVVDYYDAEGRSANLFLLRTPIIGGRYTSGYGMRRDPFLGSRTMHTGVDWAAPTGTPIMAAGDGVVVSAGRNGGYGIITRIRHTNGYETAYAHQSRIATGIAPGVEVRQGQVIGYVGSTGRSTGSHLHYEVRINGNLQDPSRIALPRGQTLQGEMLAGFLAERDRINALLGLDQEGNPTTTQLALAP